VQIHAMQDDPYFVGGDLEAARALVASAEQAQLCLYPGDKHLFAEAGSPWYDAKAADLMKRCVLDFLSRR
jgi:dienelactone hydrolase